VDGCGVLLADEQSIPARSKPSGTSAFASRSRNASGTSAGLRKSRAFAIGRRT